VTVTSPTSVPVSVTGQVSTSQGRGIGKVYVTLTGENGAVRQAITNGFGYFRFDGVATGNTYTVSVRHKSYQFADPAQVVFVGAEITDLMFVASP
jgi:hypothetical protein